MTVFTQRPHFIRLFLASVLGIMFFMPSYGAKVYKWTDENGQVHFSQTPPREETSEGVRVHNSRPSAGTPSNPYRIPVNKPSDAEKETEEDTAAASEDEGYSAEEKTELCQRSRTLLSTMQGNPNRRYQQEDGSYRKISEEERADYVSQAQDGIQRFCQ